MHSDGLVSWFGILARHETTRQAWLRVDRRGNIFDFWGRNMKTFPGKSSQRPLIRSGSEWPLYLGLGRMKAFLARERERERERERTFALLSLAPLLPSDQT